MDADLLIVSGNPAADITALTRIEAVYRMGHPAQIKTTAQPTTEAATSTRISTSGK